MGVGERLRRPIDSLTVSDSIVTMLVSGTPATTHARSGSMAASIEATSPPSEMPNTPIGRSVWVRIQAIRRPGVGDRLGDAEQVRDRVDAGEGVRVDAAARAVHRQHEMCDVDAESGDSRRLPRNRMSRDSPIRWPWITTDPRPRTVVMTQ